MKIIDILEETYSALFSNKVRTGLTMLGIVIGISSVIAMISIGQGAQNSIQANIQSIGSNLVLIMPGAQKGVGVSVSAGRGSAQSLTLADSEAIATLTNVMAVAPEVDGRYQITTKGQNTNTSVIGTVSSYPNVRNVQIAEGSFISDQNVAGLSKVAVLGPTARDDLFGVGASNVVGQDIRIKGDVFKVIGITTTKGGSGFGSQDDMVFVPLSSAQKFLVGNDYLSDISVEAQNAGVMATLQTDITNLLLVRHNIKNAAQADFSTLNEADIVATASSVTSTFTILLGAVAGISLLVGGIGIMNMMLTTVTERTREIGLRKAIGAKASDISKQFLIEAVMLTLIGGLIGVILGWSISYLITYFGVLETQVSITSVLLAFGVSALIGIMFGYYPARRAAGLNPIDALRYE
jgi:putative ABC transport system permease protein